MEPATRSKVSTIAKTIALLRIRPGSAKSSPCRWIERRGRPAYWTSSSLGRSAPLVSARVDQIAVEECLGDGAAGRDRVAGGAQEPVLRGARRSVAAEPLNDQARRHRCAGTGDAEGGGAGHVGRGHAGTGDRVVTAALPGRQDADTRGGDGVAFVGAAYGSEVAEVGRGVVNVRPAGRSRAAAG